MVIARLTGSILYIGNRIWADDVDPDEAVEMINELSNLPGAPTGVRILAKVRHNRKTPTGWPK